MWLRDPIPVEVSRVAVTPIGFQLIDETTNAPFDLTGFTLSCAVAVADGEAALATHDAPIADDIDGTFDVVFDGSAYGVPGETDAVTLAYQIKADDGSGQSLIVMRGPLFLVPGI